jgi:hypothetical protein
MATSGLEVTRKQILAFRRRVGGLDERADLSTRSLRAAAWAGLQDSMPRAALLSIHARVAGTDPETLDDPSLVQVWGPGYSAYVVAERDRAIFTVGRWPDAPKARRRAKDLADRLEEFLAGDRMPYSDAGKALGVSPNALRYAAPTGRVLIRWDGAGKPVVWTVPAPDMDPADARLELARRYLRVFGPATAEGFAGWAGIPRRSGIAAFHALESSLVPVTTPIGDAWLLTDDETALRENPGPAAPARLLPSGDTYFLLHGDARSVLVLDPGLRRLLWTSRVWPGALLVDGEVVGTWRRARETVTITPWRELSPADRDAADAEAVALPLPGVDLPIRIIWED